MPISYDNIAGSVTIRGIAEDIPGITSAASGVINYDFSSQGNIGVYVLSAGNFTLNITNLPVINNRSFVITQIIEQTSTAYSISALQIAGSAQTINWANGVTPTPTANKKEVYTFVLYYKSSAWTVLGSMTSYG